MRALIPALAGAMLVTACGDGGGQQAAVTTSTTKIVRQDLVDRSSEEGTLGYAGSLEVSFPIEGVVTRAPAIGATIRPNHRLYQVDGEDVYLLDGQLRAWRTLEPGLSGADVRQLERNLRSFAKLEVDGTWDPGTTTAVLRWQKSKGLSQTGTIELGRVVFQPGVRRVESFSASGGAVTLETTSTRRLVTVDLATSKVGIAKRGARVRVELPTGGGVGGRIVSVGRVATVSGEDEEPTVPIGIRLTGALGAASRRDKAPVTVELERRRASDVLTIPVTALMARSGGGYAVEVRDGSDARIVPVEPGLYAGGAVEIEGAGLRAGMTVSNGTL
jgi:peptidoglycan hydrolase-like protein with peptidoglycan-binding domain